MSVIKVKDVAKKFKIYKDKPATLKDKVIFRHRNAYDSFWALKNINIEIGKGETVGLIGQNGCGKSTLLKLLSEIMYPTNGTIEVNGRVSSLIELGAGFHPDMTGRENIYTNASIFGLSKREIDRRIKSIIDFSELHEFIDNAVRTYSSGMYMRLAFSVSISVDPDILLIDEILAVGDANFQRKCFERLYKLKKKGITIVFVSHDIGSVQRFCDRAIWLLDGEVKADGVAYEIANNYLDYMSDLYEDNRHKAEEMEPPAVEEEPQVQAEVEVEKQEEAVVTEEIPKRRGNKKVVLSNPKITDLRGKEIDTIKSGESLVIQYDYTVRDDIDSAVFGIAITRSDGLHCYGTNTFLDNFEFNLNNKNGTVKFIIEKLNLAAGKYFVDVDVVSKLFEDYDRYGDAINFHIKKTSQEVGLLELSHNWELN